MPNPEKITSHLLAHLDDISGHLREAVEEIGPLAELIFEAERTAAEENGVALERLRPIAERMRLLQAEAETLREVRALTKSVYNATRLEIGVSMRGLSAFRAREHLSDATDTLFAKKYGLEPPVARSRKTQTEQQKEKAAV